MDICKSVLHMDGSTRDGTTYVVQVTGLLNENTCRVGGGRFEDGDSNWKWKHSKDFVVSDCKNEAEAVAFVVALGMENSLVLKEWPCKVMSLEQWHSDLINHEESALAEGFNAPYGGIERIVNKARHVSPKDVKASKAEMAAKEAKYGI